AIYDRALSAGELYTAAASAIGAIGPKMFADLQGPVDQVYAGDPLVLTIDVGGSQPMTFTWRRNGSVISTTTNGVLTIANSTFLDSGTYEVTASNAGGSIPSQQVSVTIASPSAPSVAGSTG